MHEVLGAPDADVEVAIVRRTLPPDAAVIELAICTLVFASKDNGTVLRI